MHRAAELRHLLLPVLHALQDRIGWISEGALNHVAERLGVPPAEAYGVATFYALLATTQQPGRVIHVCDDIACRVARGGDPAAGFATVLGPEGADRDGVAWRRSPCLGRCEQGAAAYVQDVTGAPRSTTTVDPEVLRDGTPVVPPPSLHQRREELSLLRRVGEVDPGSLDAYRERDGYRALAAAIEMGPQAVIDEVKASRLRGRGGAAFPAGVKWEAVAAAPAPRHLVCNADESEPGTFKDRVLMEGDPFAVVEAMTIAGLATGCRQGWLYVRGEYPEATAGLASAIDRAREAGLLGDDVAGSGVRFDIEVRRGAGAYICGEETALFNSIEGHRGEPRQKPPFPTDAGLFGRPTLVNNVETLCNIPRIVLEGGAAFAATGTAESTGTRLFCLSGSVARPGIYEVEFGATLAEVLALAGTDASSLRAVLLGGAAGSFVGPDQFDLALTFEATRAAGLSLGSGVVMAFDHGVDFTVLARRIAAFFRDESCGQCVPCRVGTVRQEESLARYLGGGDRAAEAELIGEIAAVMSDASICGLGHTAAIAVRSAIRLGLLDGVAP